MNKNMLFSVADHRFSINILNEKTFLSKMPNLLPFVISSSNNDLIFKLDFGIKNNNLEIINKMHSFQVELFTYELFLLQSNIVLLKLNDNVNNIACDAIIDVENRKVTINIDESESSSIILNNVLSFAYTFMTINLNTITVHSSVTVFNNKAYLFLGKSGTGKSTHTGLWLKHLDNVKILNDDCPVVRIIDNKVYAYGSPWSGKGAVYLQEKYEIGAIVRLKQAPENKIEKRSGALAFITFYPSCSNMLWDDKRFERMNDTIRDVVVRTSVYEFFCLPNKEAVDMSFNTIV